MNRITLPNISIYFNNEVPLFDFWRGDNYYTGRGLFGAKKILILGESHYTKTLKDVGTTQPGFTSGIVRSYPLGKRHNPFFNNLTRAMLGLQKTDPWRPQSDAFWHSVAFYNYVPVFVDGRPESIGGNDRRPQDSMFEAGSAPFKTVLAELAPDAVVVCGLTLWNWVAPNLDGFTGPPGDVIFYDDGKTLYSRIHHPSYRKFDPAYWHHRLQTLIEMTAQPRVRGKSVVWSAP